MRLFVKLEVFDTVTGPEEVARVRRAFGGQIQRILGSGKVVASGVFTDARGGFFLLDVGSPEELLELLGGAVLDHCRVETHPVMSFEKLGEFFQREAAG